MSKREKKALIEPINDSSRTKIPYKNQILKQISNSKYGSKTYTNLVNKKHSKTTQNGSKRSKKVSVKKTYPIADEDLEKFKNVPKGNNSSIDFATEMDEPKHKKSNIIDHIDEDTNKIIEPNNTKLTKKKSNKQLIDSKHNRNKSDQDDTSALKMIDKIEMIVQNNFDPIENSSLKSQKIKEKSSRTKYVIKKIKEQDALLNKFEEEIEKIKEQDTRLNKIEKGIEKLKEQDMRMNKIEEGIEKIKEQDTRLDRNEEEIEKMKEYDTRLDEIEEEIGKINTTQKNIVKIMTKLSSELSHLTSTRRASCRT